ncbi:MAG: hypothetical protein R5N74_07105, partial [Cutibacterium granulosum]|nr:hypothetical protein [Cutibacterium granulosum]
EATVLGVPMFWGCPCSEGAHRLFSQHRLVAQGAGRVVLETGTLAPTQPDDGSSAFPLPDRDQLLALPRTGC